MKTLVWEAPRVMNVRQQDVPKVGATRRQLNFSWLESGIGGLDCGGFFVRLPDDK
jgi:hypothetical protein